MSISVLSELMHSSALINLFSGVFFCLLFLRLKIKKTREEVFHYLLFGIAAILNFIFIYPFALLLDRGISLTTRDIMHRSVVIAGTLILPTVTYFYVTYFKRPKRCLYFLYPFAAFFSLWAIINTRLFLFKEPHWVSSYYVGLKHGSGLYVWAVYILAAAGYSLFIIVDSMLNKWRQDRHLSSSIMFVSFAHAIWLITGSLDALTAVQVFDIFPTTWIGSMMVAVAISWMLIVEVDDNYREKNRFYDKMIHDPLTGAYSRTYFELKLSSLSEELKNRPMQGYLAFFDLDGLKTINDTLGHSHGDMALASVANAFRVIIRRSTDTIARYGGDEFVIMVTRLTVKSDIKKVMSRFEKIMNNLSYVYKGKEYPISCSVGITKFDEDCKDIPELSRLLIAKADEALYESKKQGKNKVTFLEISECGNKGVGGLGSSFIANILATLFNWRDFL